MRRRKSKKETKKQKRNKSKKETEKKNKWKRILIKSTKEK